MQRIMASLVSRFRPLYSEVSSFDKTAFEIFGKKSGQEIGRTRTIKTFKDNNTLKTETSILFDYPKRGIKQVRMEYADGSVISHSIKTNKNGDIFESVVRKNADGSVPYKVIKNGDNFKMYSVNKTFDQNGKPITLNYIAEAGADGKGIQQVFKDGELFENRPVPSKFAIENMMTEAKRFFNCLG